jgi:hypothetical protein
VTAVQLAPITNAAASLIDGLIKKSSRMLIMRLDRIIDVAIGVTSAALLSPFAPITPKH